MKKQQSKCDCKFNDIEKQEIKDNELIKENEILDLIAGDYLELINSSNIFIVKCYKYIFRYITDSFGALISLIILCLSIIFTILFYIKELPTIKIYIFALIENYLSFLNKPKLNFPPKKLLKIRDLGKNNITKIKKENQNDNKDKGKKHITVNSSKTINIKEKTSSNNLIVTFKNTSTKKTNNLFEQKTLNNLYLINDKTNAHFFKEYLKTSLDDLYFDDAIVKDKRTFCEYFCENFKDKQIIANTFFAKDPLKTRYIKIILFIFDILLNFVINALFISEDYIRFLYQLEEEDTFFSFIPRSISRLIKTTLVGGIIGYITSFFFIEENKIKSLFKREKNNKKALKQNVISLIKELKKMYLAFIILVFAIALISFFYLLCFNYVYPYTQIEWIKTSIMVIIIRQILSGLIILLEAILRFLSFKTGSEKIYKISKVFK